MTTKAEGLTQSGYKQLRSRVAQVVAGGPGVYPLEPDHIMMAERLIDAGYIDVDAVLGLP